MVPLSSGATVELRKCSISRSLPMPALFNGFATDPALFRTCFVARLALLAEEFRAALILATAMIFRLRCYC